MEQDPIVAAFRDVRFYPHRPHVVEHLQTHISHVFLAGPYVYKLKKAVRFPFLDFSTTAQRQHFCREEVRLNRRLSPAVYLDVLPVTRTQTGNLALSGSGEVVDHVVWMRRLPAERMLRALLDQAAVRPEMLDRLAAMLAAFHAAASTGPEIAAHSAPDRLSERWRENLRESAVFTGQLLPVEDHELLSDFGPTFVRRHETLLRARQQGGRIREGHGDLHAEHVCFVDEPPAADDPAPLAPGIYVFDCIEFSRPLRCNDVAAEVAFLAMDLESLGHAELGQGFIAVYSAAAIDPTITDLFPFYACHLACVRGKVEGLKSTEAEVDAADRERAAARARDHFALAVRYAWQPGGPAVIACSGLSGSGKTTLAAALSTATGFPLLGSDVIRKAGGHGGAATYGAAAYTPRAREGVYEALCAAVDEALGAGRAVIADATFIRHADRSRLAAVATRHRRPYVFVECQADEAIMRGRLEARDRAPSLSDARWDTVLGQRADRDPFRPDEPHLVVDTTEGLPAARAAAVRLLWHWRQGRVPGRGAG